MGEIELRMAAVDRAVIEILRGAERQDALQRRGTPQERVLCQSSRQYLTTRRPRPLAFRLNDQGCI